MKKLLCTAYVVLTAFLLCAPAPALAEQRPAMLMTVDEFVMKYNKSAQAMDMPQMLLKNIKKQTEGGMESYQIPLTEFSLATMTTNAQQRQLCGVIVDSRGDGSPNSGAVILAAILNTVTAFTEDMKPEERKTVLTTLGFFDGMMDGKMRKVTLNDCTISTLYSEGVGVLLVVEK